MAYQSTDAFSEEWSVCLKCGAVVADQALHDEHHDGLDQ